MNRTTNPSYGLALTLGVPFPDAMARVREAFKTEGFGVLTEADVQHTLHDKIGVQMEPYTVLGMCNPSLASRAISAEPYIGLLLPCNVLVMQRDGQVEVSAQDPILMVNVTGNPQLQEIAQEARQRIDRAFDKLKS